MHEYKYNSSDQPWTLPPSIEMALTADGTGVFTSEVISSANGILASVDIVYGTPAPDTLGITTKNSGGIDLLTGLGAAIPASARIDVIPPAAFSEGLTVALTENTVAGAVVNIKLYFI